MPISTLPVSFTGSDQLASRLQRYFVL